MLTEDKAITLANSQTIKDLIPIGFFKKAAMLSF